jgi:hypothetical protein
MYATIKLRWYETVAFNLGLLLGCVLIFLSVIPVALIRLARERRRGGERNPAGRGARAAFGVLLAIGVLNLLFVVGVARWGEQPNELLAPSLMLKIILGVGVVSAVLAAGALAYAVLAWKKRWWGRAARVYYTVAAVAALAFVWFLNYWNLLGWRF